jgi:hypothetical protein
MALDVHFLPCDILFSRGEAFISKGIRFCTRSRGEERTIINHVGAIVTPGNAYRAQLIEALWTVKKHTVWEGYGNSNDRVAVYRPMGLTIEQYGKIITSLNNKEGNWYGLHKIPLHFLDWLMFNGRNVTRKVARYLPLEECSGVVAGAWSDGGLDFGVKPYSATPDDIWDFCVENPDKYQLIFPLQKLRGES